MSSTPATSSPFDWEPYSLLGRESELQSIHSAVEAVINTNDNTNKEAAATTDTTSTSIVLVYGDAGSGKTAVIESVQRRVELEQQAQESTTADKNHLLWASGSFLRPQGDEAVSTTDRDDEGTTTSPSSKIPFSGLVQAGTQLCDQILALQQEDAKKALGNKLANRIELELKPQQLHSLIAVVPGVQALLESTAAGDAKTKKITRSHSSLSLFLSSFRQFLLTIATTPGCALVLCLDDLQWAEESSRKLLRSFATEPLQETAQESNSTASFLFLGAARTAQKKENGRQSPSFHMPEPSASSEDPTSPRIVQRLMLGPLSETTVNSLISGALRVSDATQTQDLSHFVYEQVSGNPLSTVQYVEFLYRTQQITLSAKDNCFAWDTSEMIITAASDSNSTTEIASLYSHQLQHHVSDRSVQRVVAVLAILGHEVRHEVLEHILIQPQLVQLFLDQQNDNDSTAVTNLPVQEAVKEAMACGLVKRIVQNRLSSDKTTTVLDEGHSTTFYYSLAHHPIQKAALNVLLLKGSKDGKNPGDMFKGSVGQALLRMCHADNDNDGDDTSAALRQSTSSATTVTTYHEDWMLFTAVQLLNKYGSSLKGMRRVDLATSGIRATRKALSLTSVALAASYAEAAQENLGKETWTSCYPVGLELHNMATEIRFQLGEADDAILKARVIKQNSRTSEDRFRAILVLFGAYAKKMDLDAAMREAYSFLEELEVQIPDKFNKIASSMRNMKFHQLLKNRSPQELEKSLPECKDNRKLYMSQFILHLLSLGARYLGETNMYISILMTNFRLTLEQGITTSAPFAFTAYGIVLSHAGKMAQAYEYGQAAKRIGERPGFEGGSMGLIETYSFLNYLGAPARESLRGLQLCMEQSLSSGESYYVASAARFRSLLGLYAGMQLGDLEQ